MPTQQEFESSFELYLQVIPDAIRRLQQALVDEGFADADATVLTEAIISSGSGGILGGVNVFTA